MREIDDSRHAKNNVQPKGGECEHAAQEQTVDDELGDQLNVHYLAQEYGVISFACAHLPGYTTSCLPPCH